jgi:hypothetical protein
MSIGSITFSTSVSVGSSWKNWKTMPRLRPRQLGHLILVEGVQRLAADDDLARRRPLDARDEVDERRFAAARLADDGHELAARHLQVDAPQRREVAGGRGEYLDEAAGIYIR